MYWKKLSKDKHLRDLLKQQEPIELQHRKNVFVRLCASVMGQQLSTKVARVIFERFLKLYDGAEPTPQQLLDTPFEQLRAIGLSNAKARYIRNIAEHALAHHMTDEKLYAMTNEEVMDFLTPIKGVGKWTVEMLLMFTLGREDIFPVDDLGIQNAMIAIFGLDRTDKKAFRTTMLALSQNWKPYRTYASLHLWRYLDNPPG